MLLRPYQTEAVDGTLRAFEHNQSVLTVMATGLGKTVFFAHIAKKFIPRGRVMMLAHREELIYQGQEKMHAVTGVQADIEMGQNWAQRGYFKTDIVVSTVQTMNAGRDGGRMTDFKPEDFSLLIVDEAHHATAASYVSVIKHFQQNPNLRVLGVTATPDRTDEEALGKVFTAVSFEYDIRDGINDGWLVPIVQRAVFVKGLDLTAVKTTAGDLNGRELADVLEFEENLHAVATPTVELTGSRKTLIFAASVAQAERLAEIIGRHKPDSARFVCGATPKETRRKMFSDYADGKFQYLVNVGVATEGFDDPDVEVVVMARPTKSRCLFTQMAGRGTRPASNIAVKLNDYADADARKQAILYSMKPSVEIIDFVGNAGRHKLIHAADILGGNYSDDVVERANRNIERSGKPADIAGELAKAEQEIHKERSRKDEAANRERIKALAKYSTATINPFDVLDIEPIRERAWHKGKPPTHKQIATLEKLGVDPVGLTFTHASQLLDKMIGRIKDNKCSFKQANFLKKRGIDPTEVSFKAASAVITGFKNCGWKKPPNLNELLKAQ